MPRSSLLFLFALNGLSELGNGFTKSLIVVLDDPVIDFIDRMA